MGKGEGGSKAARVAAKQAAQDDKNRAASEANEKETEQLWAQGSKSNSKKQALEAKDAERQRKRLELKQLQEAEDQRQQPPKQVKAVAALREPRTQPTTPELGSDDDGDNFSGTSTSRVPLAAINASGIDDALDALSLAHDPDGQAQRIDTHPERRFPAALAKFEERRMQEMKKDGSSQGLRLGQRKDRIRKEFDRSPENPYNQLSAQYNTSRDQMRELKAGQSAKIAVRLESDS